MAHGGLPIHCAVRLDCGLPQHLTGEPNFVASADIRRGTSLAP
jgi:hypothetical protein